MIVNVLPLDMKHTYLSLLLNGLTLKNCHLTTKLIITRLLTSDIVTNSFQQVKKEIKNSVVVSR